MLPQQFLQRMQEFLGEEYESFLQSLQQDRYQALRVNTLKKNESGESPEKALAALFHLEKVPWTETGYYYEKEAQPGKHPLHEAGAYYIQEPSAMAPVEIMKVRPGERILDLCAAPGGKSTQIAAALRGRGVLVSNEIHPARAKILSENIERMGVWNGCVTNETPEKLAEVFSEYFDCILVDAPCSGEGMFRKNEEACEEWSPEGVELCAKRQDAILEQAARMLRPGGRLVYSTCTFAVQENEGSIRRFLEKHPEFSLAEIDASRFYPKESEEGKTDGEIDGKTITEGNEGEGGRTDGEIDGKTVTEGNEGDSVDGHGRLAGTLRLYPHKLKGEGHFAALLQKTGEIPEGYRAMALSGLPKEMPDRELGEWKVFQEENLKENLLECLTRKYGETQDLKEDAGKESTETQDLTAERVGKESAETQNLEVEDAGKAVSGKYVRFGDNVYLVTEEAPGFSGLKVLRPGLHLGTLKKNRFEPSHALALALSPAEARRVWYLRSGEPEAAAYLKGQTFSAEGEKGWYLICVDGFSLGWGKLAGGIMKNHYPKGLRK